MRGCNINYILFFFGVNMAYKTELDKINQRIDKLYQFNSELQNRLENIDKTIEVLKKQNKPVRDTKLKLSKP